MKMWEQQLSPASVPSWVRKIIDDLLYGCDDCKGDCHCLDDPWFWPDAPLTPPAPFWR